MLDNNRTNCRNSRIASALLISLILTSGLVWRTQAEATDWARFRGPNGSGINAAGKVLPANWSVSKNTKWRIALPGPGHSSPIIVGNHIVLTYWTGYAINTENLGGQERLRLHLLCVDSKDGATIWDQEIEPELPVDEYGGSLALHGYASHTPVSDGEKIFAFFGTTGVVAFDMNGTKLWQAKVGKELNSRQRGSAASPILHNSLVIVTASIEAGALVAIDKETGHEVWRRQSEDFRNTWGTPVLVHEGGRTELVLSVPNKILAFAPDTGEPLWHCDGSQDNTASASPIVHDDVVYVIGGRGGGTVAVRSGGMGDVNQTHVLWESGRSGVVASPIRYMDRLYWIGRETAYCLDAATGKGIYRTRIARSRSNAGRSSRSGNDYASPVAAGDHMYHLRSNGEMVTIQLGEQFKELSRTSFDGSGEFLSTPAISKGRMIVRSTKHLYCIRM